MVEPSRSDLSNFGTLAAARISQSVSPRVEEQVSRPSESWLHLRAAPSCPCIHHLSPRCGLHSKQSARNVLGVTSMCKAEQQCSLLRFPVFLVLDIRTVCYQPTLFHSSLAEPPVDISILCTFYKHPNSNCCKPTMTQQAKAVASKHAPWKC